MGAPALEGCLLVNTGEFLTRITNGKWLNTVHKVIQPPEGKHRYSLGCFFPGQEQHGGPPPAVPQRRGARRVQAFDREPDACRHADHPVCCGLQRGTNPREQLREALSISDTDTAWRSPIS